MEWWIVIKALPTVICFTIVRSTFCFSTGVIFCTVPFKRPRKFPKPDDTRNIAAGEILALALAAEAGIQVAEHQIVPVGGQGVAVITRFDRVGRNRIPFISAATLLALPQGDQAAYTMLADGIRQFGNNVPGDLRELWRRLVFSLLASNYDDHLRNHGFLMHESRRWSLSPAYDINPVPEMDQISDLPDPTLCPDPLQRPKSRNCRQLVTFSHHRVRHLQPLQKCAIFQPGLPNIYREEYITHFRV